VTDVTQLVPLAEFDDVTIRVRDLQLDDEWRAWLYAHAQTQGGLALAFRRMVLFHALVALLRQSHETEQRLRTYLLQAGYERDDAERVIRRWRRGEATPELGSVAAPVTVTPPPPRVTASQRRPSARRRR
jgi:hypothetical protein